MIDGPAANSPTTDHSDVRRSFPENDLAKWLFAKTKRWSRHLWYAASGPDYRILTQFSHDFETCLRSSGDIARGLELCIKPIRRTPLGKRWSTSVESVRNGSTLTEAFSPAEEILPPFFLPVVAVGEQSGRLVEAFAFLENHCKLLAGPASALRNVWFFPLVILVAGALLRVFLQLMSGSILGAISTLFGEIFGWLQIVLVVALIMLTPVRYFFDQLRLSVPFVGALEREIALHRFFRVMALVYSVGGDRVEVMIRTSANTVSNRAARIDLRKAAKAIESGATISEAFRRVSLINDREQTGIEVGETSGTLEKAFSQLSDETGASMVTKLSYIQPILVRIVTAAVVLSLVSTLLKLAFRGE